MGRSLCLSRKRRGALSPRRRTSGPRRRRPTIGIATNAMVGSMTIGAMASATLE
jgi:hypothetical protein